MHLGVHSSEGTVQECHGWVLLTSAEGLLPHHVLPQHDL